MTVLPLQVRLNELLSRERLGALGHTHLSVQK